jgi:hypothetical protein
MIKQLVGGLAVAAVVVGASASAHAQCTYQHPQKASKFQGSFVQAFVSCGNTGGNSPNTFAGGGAAPACKPPETFNEQAGSPATGWLWGPKGTAAIQLKAKKKNVFPTTTPADPDASDLAINLKAKDLEYPPGNGSVLVDGPTAIGTLSTVSRTTFNDRDPAVQDVTVVDFPVNITFTVVGGKVKVKTSANQALNGGGLAGLPHCTSIETVKITILDENNHAFGNVGTFLP